MTTTEKIECAVIGAGVIGLAVARALALAGREVVVLEAAEAIGTGASSRNSEVIHAGLYYPEGSLKARLCRYGRDLLYAYLAERGIDHRRCGKLVVASAAEEEGRLAALAARARANGVEDVRLIGADEARAMEPALACTAALLSPSTGILDSHALMLAYQGDAEAAGAVLAFHAPVVAGSARPNGGVCLEVGGDSPLRLDCTRVVNAAGLDATMVAGTVAGLRKAALPEQHYAKGNYFTLAGRAPFERLVYPLPNVAGLGIHYTVDLGGQGRFGPDVEWIAAPNYDVDPARGDAFYAAIRRYWPALPDGALQPGYAGVRTKLQGAGGGPQDFVIQGPADHGIAGLINLFGIESPGLTASLAIAEAVAARLTIASARPV